MSTATKPRLFITGSTGYIGSVIAEFAVAEGYEVHGLSRSKDGDTKLRSLGAVPVRGDLTCLDLLRQQSSQAQCVMHLAMLSFSFGFDEVLSVDAAAVDAMVEGLQGTKSKLITTSGSLVVAPDPNGGETTETSSLSMHPLNRRIESEEHALEWCKKGVDVCAIRLAPYVYGRGGSGIKLFMSRFAQIGEVSYMNEAATSAIHVDDAARMYLLAAKKANAGDIFNCTSSTDVTNRQIAEAMGSLLNIPVRLVTFEEMEVKFARFFAEFLRATNRASSAKAMKELGWQPREPGLLEDIYNGSYPAVAKELRKA